MHRMLARQLRRHFGDAVPAAMKSFLDDVAASYAASDDDRAMLERSLELTSRELLAQHKVLRDRQVFLELEREALVALGRGLAVGALDEGGLARAVADVIGWVMRDTTADVSMEVPEPERGVLIVPLRERGCVVFRRKLGEPWTADELGFASSVRDLVQAAVERIERERAESKQQRLEEELRQSQKLEAIGTLAGGVAHDFNNLLMPILTCSDLLRETLSNDPEAQELLRDITQAANTCRDLTRQLLAFGRRQVLELKIIDWNEEVRLAARMLQRTIPENIAVAVELSKTPCWVQADASQLQQVMLNLGINARDAMPDGGRLLFSTCADDKQVVLRVRDTGTGMTQELAAKIFEPFFTTKEKGHGTGLGLAMVHGIVEQHEGTIAVDTELGGGTTFEIRLPAAQPVTRRGDAQVRADAGNGETVLVVEDDELVRRAVRRGLEAGGYRVVLADSGVSALALAADTQFSLVLSDVVMPGMDGPSVFEALQRTQPNAKLLLMSGHAQEVVGGATTLHLLRKPFTTQELLARVRTTVNP